jgi:hypothetical protein
MATPSKNNNMKDIEAKVFAKAWKDATFKKKLLSNPKAALTEMGYTIPEGVNVRCIEDAKNSLTIVLPATPAGSAQLSEAELSKIAGGGGLGNTGTEGCIPFSPLPPLGPFPVHPPSK